MTNQNFALLPPPIRTGALLGAAWRCFVRAQNFSDQGQDRLCPERDRLEHHLDRMRELLIGYRKEMMERPPFRRFIKI